MRAKFKPFYDFLKKHSLHNWLSHTNAIKLLMKEYQVLEGRAKYILDEMDKEDRCIIIRKTRGGWTIQF